MKVYLKISKCINSTRVTYEKIYKLQLLRLFMGQSILLRKLTEKSILNFGKYNGLTVRQILDLNHPNYLRWIYFNVNGVSFVDEILKEIKISDNYKIKKPGKYLELFSELECEIFKRMNPLKKYILNGVQRKQREREYFGYIKRDNLAFSDDFKTRVNHGKENYGLAKLKTKY